jgi:hypothetical protein
MRTRISVVVGAAAGLLYLAPSAQAQNSEEVGENLGDLLSGWAEALYVGIAALIALVFLMNRKYSELAVFFLAAILVGGFVLAPNSVAGTVEDIWRTVTG